MIAATKEGRKIAGATGRGRPMTAPTSTGDTTPGRFDVPFLPGGLLSAGLPREHRVRSWRGYADVTANIAGLAAGKDRKVSEARGVGHIHFLRHPGKTGPGGLGNRPVIRRLSATGSAAWRYVSAGSSPAASTSSHGLHDDPLAAGKDRPGRPSCRPVSKKRRWAEWPTQAT